ncbi:MAG: hypothetical protein ACKO11_06470 [Cuspidothrix sp.]
MSNVFKTRIMLNLLNDHSWYSLQIPPQALEFTSFHQVKQWQEIAVALLKKYCDRLYKSSQSAWESQYLEFLKFYHLPKPQKTPMTILIFVGGYFIGV